MGPRTSYTASGSLSRRPVRGGGDGGIKRKESVLLIVLIPALLAFALVATACGGDETTTTIQAMTTSTQAATDSTQVVTTSSTAVSATTTSGAATTATTTATASVTLPSLQMTPAVQAYIKQMQAWADALDLLPQASDPLSITSVSTVTDEQVQAAAAFATMAHGALDQLKTIKPPAEVAAFQESLTTALSSQVDATDKAAQALRNKDQAMLDAAIAQGDQIELQWSALMDSVQSLLTGGPPAS